MGFLSDIASFIKGSKTPQIQSVDTVWVAGQTSDGTKARFTQLRAESDAGGGKKNIALYGKEGELTPGVGFYYTKALSPTTPPTFIRMGVKVGD